MEDLQKDNEVISLRKIIVDYARHWRLFLSFFIISLTIAGAYLLFYPTTYEIMARIQLQEDKDMGSGSLGLGDAAGLMKSFGLGSMKAGTIVMDDELVKLLSNDLLKKMVLELGINVDYIKPYSYNYRMYDDLPFILQPDSATNATLSYPIVFNIDVTEKGTIEVTIKTDSKKQKLNFESLPAIIKVDEQSYTLSYRKSKDFIKPYSQKIVVSPATWIAENLSNDFTIEEYSKNSNVIELICTDYEKNRGIDMLNTLIQLYNEQESTLKSKEGNQSIDFLTSRIKNITEELSTVEEQIEQYKTKHQMTDIEYDVKFYTEQMKELQVKIIELEAQSYVIKFVSDYVRDPQNKYNLIPALLSTGDDKGNPIATYNEALIERERIMQSSKNNSPLINNINKQVDQLRNSVYLSIENAEKSVQLTLADLKSKEKVLLDKMKSVPAVEKEYIDFKRQQEICQAVYLILLQKREEIALSINDQRDRARIIDPAFIKQSPVAPRKLFAFLGIIIFTIVLPVVYLFVRNQYIALKEVYKQSE